MKNNLKYWRGAVAMAVLILGLAVPTTSPLADDGNNEELRRLSAEWWEWSLSIPAPANPLNDATGALCGVGQHGEVWFLGGTLDGSEVNRTCSIPAGKAIFLPVINAECSTAEGNGTTRKELRGCAKALIDHVTEVEATVDGRTLQQWQISRVLSPLFMFTLPPDNVLGILDPDPNPSPSVSDGFWVLLAPLSVGVHTIEFHGIAPFPEFGFTFEQKGTYTLTVVPLSL